MDGRLAGVFEGCVPDSRFSIISGYLRDLEGL